MTTCSLFCRQTQLHCSLMLSLYVLCCCECNCVTRCVHLSYLHSYTVFSSHRFGCCLSIRVTRVVHRHICTFVNILFYTSNHTATVYKILLHRPRTLRICVMSMLQHSMPELQILSFFSLQCIIMFRSLW